jgi:hypothetical protein
MGANRLHSRVYMGAKFRTYPALRQELSWKALKILVVHVASLRLLACPGLSRMRPAIPAHFVHEPCFILASRILSRQHQGPTERNSTISADSREESQINVNLLIRRQQGPSMVTSSFWE